MPQCFNAALSHCSHPRRYRSGGSIRAFVREVVETGAIPLIVGGDHAIMYREWHEWWA